MHVTVSTRHHSGRGVFNGFRATASEQCLEAEFRGRRVWPPENRSVSSTLQTPEQCAVMAEALSTENLSRMLSHPTEIVDALRTIAQQGLELSLRVTGFGNEIRARILHVDETTILLGELKPQLACAALAKSQEGFMLAGRGSGLYVFASDVMPRHQRRPASGEQLEAMLPEQLIYQQRRRAPRISLPSRGVAGKGARLHLQRGTEMIKGTIVDISIGGCRARIDLQAPPQLTVGEVIDNCQVQLTRHTSITARVAVRHVASNVQTAQVFCGIEFLTMAPDCRATLEKFVERVSSLKRETA
jgi:c-di-GMP-binding flagellar brake protein YcgR